MDGGQKKKNLMIAAGLLCLITAGVMMHAFGGKFGTDTAGISSVPPMMDTIDVTVRSRDAASSQVSTAAQAPMPPSEMFVYMTGCVKKPGIYKVPAGSRIFQAVDMAGGLTQTADPDAVNLALKAADGMHLHFPSKAEVKERKKEAAMHDYVKQPSVTVTAPEQPQQKAQASAPRVQAQNGVSAAVSGVINVNSASQTELESLPGIGPKTAQAMISWRESNGGFKRVEDLLEVKGIGPKKYDTIKGLVTVGR